MICYLRLHRLDNVRVIPKAKIWMGNHRLRFVLERKIVSLEYTELYTLRCFTVCDVIVD